MQTVDPNNATSILVRQHHRGNHDRGKDEYGDYSSPNPGESIYRGESTNETRRSFAANRHSSENIHYEEDYEKANDGVNGGRRHSISSDYLGKCGYAYQTGAVARRNSEKDRSCIKQSWYETIRDRYQSVTMGSKKDIQFPKPLENYRTKYSEVKSTIIRSGSKLWEDGDKRRLTEKRKKTVRFDGGLETNNVDDGWMTLGNTDRWGSLRQGSQDSGTKDSGIETSSNFTSSEDSNRGEFKVPLVAKIAFFMKELGVSCS